MPEQSLPINDIRFTSRRLVRELGFMGGDFAGTDLPLEIHTHDDLGLATANALAAVRAGARHVSVTVGGIESATTKQFLLD